VAEAATPGEAESPVEELVAPTVEEPAAPAAEAFEERDPELVEIFLEEGFDILDSAAAALQRWIDDVDNTIARPAYPQGRCADGRDRRDRRPRP
jgi:chemosensory pili system protein ChpA (sensor histidine kinase/response regulator)